MFAGVRGLFLDLQLLDNAVSGDYRRHFALINTILEENISPLGGPFILVLWTDAPERAEELEEYLVGSIPPDKIHCLPVAVIALSKTDYISIENGSVRDAASLTAAVEERLNSSASLRVAIEWEVDVLGAASIVLRDLLANVPAGLAQNEKRTTGLANLLRAIATAEVGEGHYRDEARAAIHAGLLPMLSDTILNDLAGSSRPNVWRQAFLEASTPPVALGLPVSAQLNTRAHLASAGSDGIMSSAWGAVSVVPDNFRWRSVGLVGPTRFLEKDLGLQMNDGDRSAATIVRVRVGAACDYAQEKPGPIPLVLGAFVPAMANGKARGLPGGSNLWISPPLQVGGNVRHLVINPRLIHTLPPRALEGAMALYRIREQLFMDLLARLGFHGSRPGYVRFG